MGEKNRTLDLNELRDITGGFKIKHLERIDGERAIEYQPDLGESIFGGVDRGKVAVEIAKRLGEGSEQKYLQKVNDYLQNKLEQDPHYFRYKQILRSSDIWDFKK